MADILKEILHDYVKQNSDIEIERQVIGGLLVEPKHLEEFSLTDGDFVSESHKRLFFAILLVYGEGKDVNPITVKDKLFEIYGEDNLIINEMANCLESALTPVNTVVYMKKLRELSLKRKLIIGLLKSVEELQNKPIEVVRMNVEYLLANINPEVGVKSVSEDFDWEEVETLIEAKTFHTHLSTLNNTARITKGELISIVGDTSRGKTMFTLNIVDDILKQEGKVLYFSLDMSRIQLIMRFASMHQQIPLHEIKPDNPNFKQILETEIKQKYMKNLFEFHKSAEISTAINVARAIKPDVVVFDYIQNFRDRRYEMSRSQELSNIMLALQQEAMKYPVIALSQVSKGEGDDFLARAKGSSTIAQASSLVIEVDKNEDTYKYKIKKNRTWGTTTGWINLRMMYGYLMEEI